MMNKERFQELIARPDRIIDSDLVELQGLVRDFPYFHNAHFLLLYGLYRQKPETFGGQLKQSSLSLSNRTFFVNAIFQGWQNTHDVSEPEPAAKLELAPVEPFVNEPSEDKLDNIPLAIDEPVKEVILEVAPSLVPAQDSELMKEPEPFSEEAQQESFTLSFEDSQVMDTVEKKDIEVAAKDDVNTDLLELDVNATKEEDGPSEDLIDYFLKVNPRIVPKLDLEDARGDISTPWLEENEEIVTETLANIYEQQGHYLKAKDAFRKLILKFPEKSTYFASRIQELEKRIK